MAVLETGIMGAAMARNLAGAGMAVRAWNRTHEKAGPLAEDGVAAMDTPVRAAEEADFLITMHRGGVPLGRPRARIAYP